MTLDLSRALPILERSVGADETAPLVAQGVGDAPVFGIYIPTVLVTYGVDVGGTFAPIRRRDLGDLDGDALHARALANLRALAHSKLALEQRGPLIEVTLDGRLEASLLLLDELWAGDSAPRVEGDLVAAMPARNVLSLTGSKSAIGLASLRERVRGVAQDDNALVPTLLVRRGNEWDTLD